MKIWEFIRINYFKRCWIASLLSTDNKYLLIFFMLMSTTKKNLVLQNAKVVRMPSKFSLKCKRMILYYTIKLRYDNNVIDSLISIMLLVYFDCFFLKKIFLRVIL